MATALKLLLLPQLYLSTRRSTPQSKLLSSYDFLQHYTPSTAGIDIRDKCNPIYVDIFGGPNRRARLGLKQPYLSLRRSISRSISSAECNPNFGNSSGGVNRRRSGLCLVVLMASLASLFPANEASGIDFNLIAPDQTAEEAKSKIRGHAEALLEVKYLIESESWKEAQIALRSSASYLKQDIRTIIMFKPANERPPLRKLYAVLFNNVTTLDYAAREKDAARVWECYENIVAALTDILSRISRSIARRLLPALHRSQLLSLALFISFGLSRSYSHFRCRQIQQGKPFKIALFADLHFSKNAWGPQQDVNSVWVMSIVLNHENPRAAQS